MSGVSGYDFDMACVNSLDLSVSLSSIRIETEAGENVVAITSTDR